MLGQRRIRHEKCLALAYSPPPLSIHTLLYVYRRGRNTHWLNQRSSDSCWWSMATLRHIMAHECLQEAAIVDMAHNRRAASEQIGGGCRAENVKTSWNVRLGRSSLQSLTIWWNVMSVYLTLGVVCRYLYIKTGIANNLYSLLMSYIDTNLQGATPRLQAVPSQPSHQACGHRTYLQNILK